MKIREDVAIGPDDKTGTFALDRTRPARVSARIVFIRWPLKEQVVERRTLADVVLLRNLNDYDAGCDSLEDFCKGVIQLVNDVFA